MTLKQSLSTFAILLTLAGAGDQSWTGSGTCTNTYRGGDKLFESWEEGSQLKEYTFKTTGGTGKYEGATGGGTYFYESLTDTLAGGTYKGTLQLP